MRPRTLAMLTLLAGALLPACDLLGGVGPAPERTPDTPVVVSRPRQLSEPEYDALWNDAQVAVFQITRTAARLRGRPSANWADLLERGAGSLGTAVAALAANEVPPSRIILRRSVLPTYREIHEQVLRAAAAARSGDAYQFERHWRLLAALLADAEARGRLAIDIAGAALAPEDAGFSATWVEQSPNPRLAPGQRATLVVAFRNSGSRGWSLGRRGEEARLGTAKPLNRAYPELAHEWLWASRPAAQTTAYVGPGQVGWFEFRIRGPSRPGTYRLDVRPLIEGAGWLEDSGVHWIVAVRP